MKRRFTAACSTSLAALAILAAGVFSTAASADAKRSTVLIAAPIDVKLGASRNEHSVRRVARHGVYVYVPHYASPNFVLKDDWSEDDDLEFDEFESADSDNDGFISFREARRANAEWARNFRRIDTSGDGFLTQEEIDEFYKRPSASQ